MEQPETPDKPKPDETPAAPTATVEDATSPEDELPEWEPLSPELLEDEAIRGDFVLRWAVVGLALLLGCSQLSDARPLVHAQSGAWLASHGVLPTGEDPFSIAGADRRWVNLSWMFDLVSAGVHALTGPIGLSVFQGLLALAAWALLGHACRPGIRTWWGSVCAVMSLLAAMPRLNVTPELITLCGIATCLWLLVRCEERPSSAEWWWFVPVMWLWSQMDPRAWMGAGLIILYAVGSQLSRRSSVAITPPVSAPWKPIATAVGVMLLHPFLWETWLSPVSLYGVEYPALRAAYSRPSVMDQAWHPLWSPLLWRQVDFRLIAGMFLTFAAAAALWLDRARVTWSHMLMYFGANLVGAVTLHDFPVAALVNCVLATVHGQSWYLDRFGQVYSIAWAEVLFSRGGRAITVLALFVLAWLVISGRIDGPDGRRTGVGLDRQLQAEIDSFRKLPALTADERGFHLALRQGDALIAAGRKSFVDHRVRLFTGSGERDLLTRHDHARKSLRRARPDELLPVDPRAWQEVFEEFHLSHVLPRLTMGVSGPDYETFFELLNRPDWMLTEVLPSTAVLHWSRSPDESIRRFADEHQANVLEKGFRKPEAIRDQPHDHPVPVTWSQQLFSAPRRQLGAATLLANHWIRVVTAAPRAPLEFRAGCLMQAVRSAQSGVWETPDVPLAYSTLAEAYSLLGKVEAISLQETGMPWTTSLRYYQAVAAARDALRLNPQDASSQAMLLDLYGMAGRVDAALSAAQALVEFTATADPGDEGAAQQRSMLLEREQALNRLSMQLSDRAQQDLDKGVDRYQVASNLYQSGGVQRAVAILNDDAVYVERTPPARQLLTAALAELGAGPELDESAARLDAVGDSAGLPRWRDIVATSALGRLDFVTAQTHWERQLALGDLEQVQGLLHTSVLSTSSPLWLAELYYPTPHLVVVLESMHRRSYESATLELNRAICEIERSHPTEATAAIRRALDRAPATPLRPLLAMYLFCLTGETIDVEPPSDWIPVSADTFTTDGN